MFLHPDYRTYDCIYEFVEDVVFPGQKVITVGELGKQLEQKLNIFLSSANKANELAHSELTPLAEIMEMIRVAGEESYNEIFNTIYTMSPETDACKNAVALFRRLFNEDQEEIEHSAIPVPQDKADKILKSIEQLSPEFVDSLLCSGSDQAKIFKPKPTITNSYENLELAAFLFSGDN